MFRRRRAGELTADGDAYRRYVSDILGTEGTARADAAALAIGAADLAEFERTGRLELDLLRQVGLLPTSRLVDVGCGSGRLASQLDGWFQGDYLGTDISDELLAHARRHYGGPHRRYQQVSGLTVPVPDRSVDLVCFFSVLTHLRHEESYLYLQEARRAVVPGGRIVVSFLEFTEREHWAVFGAMVAARAAATTIPVNQFVSVDALQAWAELAVLDIEVIHHGMTPHIVTSTGDAGELATLGQSIVVFSRPPDRLTDRPTDYLRSGRGAE